MAQHPSIVNNNQRFNHHLIVVAWHFFAAPSFSSKIEKILLIRQTDRLNMYYFHLSCHWFSKNCHSSTEFKEKRMQLAAAVWRIGIFRLRAFRWSKGEYNSKREKQRWGKNSGKFPARQTWLIIWIVKLLEAVLCLFRQHRAEREREKKPLKDTRNCANKKLLYVVSLKIQDPANSFNFSLLPTPFHLLFFFLSYLAVKFCI